MSYFEDKQLALTNELLNEIRKTLYVIAALILVFGVFMVVLVGRLSTL